MPTFRTTHTLHIHTLGAMFHYALLNDELGGMRFFRSAVQFIFRPLPYTAPRLMMIGECICMYVLMYACISHHPPINSTHASLLTYIETSSQP
jgi:hypothetical protein